MKTKGIFIHNGKEYPCEIEGFEPEVKKVDHAINLLDFGRTVEVEHSVIFVNDVETAKQYKAYLEALAALREYREGLGVVPNWEDDEQDKYYPYYNHNLKTWDYYIAGSVNIGCIYGYYESSKQVKDLISKNEKELNIVREWIEVHGV
jgi:hypothetical protein